MKKLIIACGLLIVAGALWSQEKESILFSGSFVSMPQYQMLGAGYTVSFQHHLKPHISLEAGVNYTLASHTVQRNETVNNVRLLDLNYHHGGYSLYVAPVLKIGKGKAISLDIFAGPVVTYQSNVFDLNRYQLPESPSYISRMTDIVYNNEVKEGAFFGGIAGCRVSAMTGENWRVNCGFNAMGILKAVSSFNASMGIQYCW